MVPMKKIDIKMTVKAPNDFQADLPSIPFLNMKKYRMAKDVATDSPIIEANKNS